MSFSVRIPLLSLLVLFNAFNVTTIRGQESPRLAATGHIVFNSRPVPGATITASRGAMRRVTTSDGDGAYRLAMLEAGTWTLRVDMRGFVPVERDVIVGSDTTPAVWELALVTAEAAIPNVPSPVTLGVNDAPGAPEELLVAGSVHNGAASPFAQPPAFGNNRPSRGGLLSGAVALIFGDTNTDISASLAGPLRLPRLSRFRPILFVTYHHARSSTAATTVARVPTALERAGNFSESRDASGRPVAVRNPVTGLRFASDTIPPDQISPQARALVAFYPHPNLEGSDRGNYRAPIVDGTSRHGIQVRLTQSLNERNQLSGRVEYLRSGTAHTDAFAFTDRRHNADLMSELTWSHRFSQFLSLQATYGFTRTTLHAQPFFAHRANVSGDAGLTGNDQRPASWGPPSLVFATGLAGLVSAVPADSSNRAHGWGVETSWDRRGHALTFGGGLRRVFMDAYLPDNPRGTLLFTGDASGLDVADFLLGLPHVSQLAYDTTGRAFRGWRADGFVIDDWRLSAGLTVNAGIRWEYESPLTERQARLANLDVAPDFTSVAPATGHQVLTADRSGFQPRLGLSWRPRADSSLVIRAGYGLYRNTNVYAPIARLLAGQPPFSTVIDRETTHGMPLTLTTAFAPPTSTASHTFAIDQAFRVGFSETWQLSAQRDFPASLTLLVTYRGVRGHRLPQASLPNTYPPGGTNFCQTCPAGFIYVTSRGSSSKQSVDVEVRRRLRAGFTASLQYTLAKATDDAPAMAGISTSGATVAQDWQDLNAERAPSNFDQRHVVVAHVEYTTGVGVAGGALLDGLRGLLWKGWTLAGHLTTGSGLPVTPRYLTSVPGTSVAGSLRAARAATSGTAPDGFYLDPSAYAIPAPGEWGTAGRNSVTGPALFSFDASVRRSFTLRTRMTLEWRLDAKNVLNRVTYASVNNIVGSPQFGLPERANAMRTIQMTTGVRF